MSRVGKKPITIPKGLSVTFENGLLKVKGPKGELAEAIHPNIGVEIKDGEVTFTRSNDEKFNRSLHGLSRALVQNMVDGVTVGFKKTLDIIGVGYRAEMKGKNLFLTLGYSHPIYFLPPDGVSIQTPTQTQITIEGIDKQLVGQIASKVRSFRKPEPYKGKGVKYDTEFIRRKAGKTAGK